MISLNYKKQQNNYNIVINKKHLLDGVNIVDMTNTYIGRDVVIGHDTTIEPGCIIKGKTVIGNGCHIGLIVNLIM